MKYRCEIDVSFDSEDDAVAFLNHIQDIKGKVFIGTGTEKIPVLKKCRYHECFHDENPPKQCGDYINYDLSKVELDEIKTKKEVVT